MADFTDDMTLGEAKALLRTLVDEGHTCPTCTQFAKVYKRKVHATMARELIKMYKVGKRGDREYVHVITLAGANAADLVKTRYWDLIEEQPGERDDGSTRTGWWRVTEAGERWLLGQSRITKYARIFNGRCLGHVGPPEGITIGDALGSKFSYEELMHW